MTRNRKKKTKTKKVFSASVEWLYHAKSSVTLASNIEEKEREDMLLLSQNPQRFIRQSCFIPQVQETCWEDRYCLGKIGFKIYTAKFSFLREWNKGKESPLCLCSFGGFDSSWEVDKKSITILSGDKIFCGNFSDNLLSNGCKH